MRLAAADVRPPVVAGLAGERDHRVEEHEQVDGQPLADERRGEAGERLRDEHDVASVADRRHDRIGVLVPARAVIARWKRDRDRDLARRLELAHDEVPLPAVTTGAGDQDVGRHVSARLPADRPGHELAGRLVGADDDARRRDLRVDELQARRARRRPRTAACRFRGRRGTPTGGTRRRG